ncbi:MAG: STAS domain-containing protein, partial [Bacteroidales bacterium]|nr:STAS domain-containing protein [Bacteroidales bacterium]
TKQDMKTTIHCEAENISVQLLGDLDTAAAQETEKAFQPLMAEKGKKISLDCSGLNYISSSGLRLFLSLLKSCKPNGNTLTIENLNDNIRKVFTMTGFSSLFDIK